jgi:hypothetical protein
LLAVAVAQLRLVVKDIVDIAQAAQAVLEHNGHLIALIMPVVAVAQPIVALFLSVLQLVVLEVVVPAVITPVLLQLPVVEVKVVVEVQVLIVVLLANLVVVEQ